MKEYIFIQWRKTYTDELKELGFEEATKNAIFHLLNEVGCQADSKRLKE